MNNVLNFLVNSLAFGATFMYGSTGEILMEKVGHLNLGIPGIMCMGGAGGCLMLNLIGKSSMAPALIVILGIVAAFAMAMLMGLIYSFLTVTMRANQNVTGLAMTTFGTGLMAVLMKNLDIGTYLVVPKMFYRWPFAQRQDALQTFGVLFFLAFIITVLVFIQSFLIANYRVAVDYNEKRIVLRYRFSLITIPFENFDAHHGAPDKKEEIIANVQHVVVKYLVLDDVFEEKR